MTHAPHKPGETAHGPGDGAHDRGDGPVHAGHLRAVLEQLRTLVPKRRRDWAYPTFAGLVLTHGRDFAPASWTAGTHPRRTGECFAAAHEWADREGWAYCEGYALAADPVIGAFEHAWCLTPDGRVADPAIPDGWVLAYRGLPLTASFLRAQGRGDAAVITLPRDMLVGPNAAVLRDGLPSDALATDTRLAAGDGPAVPARHLPTTHAGDGLPGRTDREPLSPATQVRDLLTAAGIDFEETVHTDGSGTVVTAFRHPAGRRPRRSHAERGVPVSADTLREPRADVVVSLRAWGWREGSYGTEFSRPSRAPRPD
ncbi:hypothetical protein [Streptomyces fuscichromogenes]|uniref:Uncharacterized protein n=1 Tax=Streptomyces fuscichromogenes TaxID=1324013 RepID=A0A917XR85_9ACTN|nr:hypothetical protein [Streptomyces fuscichromogenes]GGN46657.1 hypothetical protein GCM10011578_099690 [Streptomyces fuscichromogenes]